MILVSLPTMTHHHRLVLQIVTFHLVYRFTTMSNAFYDYWLVRFTIIKGHKWIEKRWYSSIQFFNFVIVIYGSWYPSIRHLSLTHESFFQSDFFNFRNYYQTQLKLQTRPLVKRHMIWSICYNHNWPKRTVTVMLVTSWCWWLYVGDHFRMLVTKKGCW